MKPTAPLVLGVIYAIIFPAKEINEPILVVTYDTDILIEPLPMPKPKPKPRPTIHHRTIEQILRDPLGGR